MWFVHQSSLGKPRGRTWGRDGRGQEGTKGGRKTGEVGTATRATEWKPPEDNIGGLKLTKADRRHLATCLVSHTVVTPNPILSFLRSFTFPCLFFFFFSQRKMVSSEAWCEKRVARGGVGLGSVRGEGLAGFALPKLLSAGPGSSAPAPDTVGAQ